MSLDASCLSGQGSRSQNHLNTAQQVANAGNIHTLSLSSPPHFCSACSHSLIRSLARSHSSLYLDISILHPSHISLISTVQVGPGLIAAEVLQSSPLMDGMMAALNEYENEVLCRRFADYCTACSGVEGPSLSSFLIRFLFSLHRSLLLLHHLALSVSLFLSFFFSWRPTNCIS